jgi:hypothetical protein
MTEITNRNEVRQAIADGGWTIVWGDLINEWDIITLVVSLPTATVGVWVNQQLAAQLQKFQQSLGDVSDDIVKQATDYLEDLLKHRRSGERDFEGLGVKAGIATYNRKFKTFLGTTRLPNNHQPYIGLRVTKPLSKTTAISPPPLSEIFTPVYKQGQPGNGIGGFDLRSQADLSFAFDYSSSGRLDHIVLYRPGSGACFILSNQSGSFVPVYAQGDPGNGIGGYDLKNEADRAFAFDYDSSGKLDHLVFYRPGRGAIFILENSFGVFTSVYAQGDPGIGIGGFDLKSPADRIFAFDYDSSGKQDHLCIYRPGTGTFWILKQSQGNFTRVYAEGDPGRGIGDYDLKSAADHAFAFDWNSSGKLDHIALYRPGTGTFWCLNNANGAFHSVMAVGDPGSGIGGFDLRNRADVALAFDWDHSGKKDHVAIYRPGTGTFWVLKHIGTGAAFQAVLAEGDPGRGIGGFDLKHPADKIYAFDYDHSGVEDYLLVYRSNGTGTVWILKHS